MLEHPELRFVFGYEQALGYLVADRPLDKDGITAAVLLAEIAAVAAAEGAHAAGPARRHRRPLRPPRHWPTLSVRMTPADAAAKVAATARRPAGEIGGRAVAEHRVSIPEADLLRFELEGGVRVQIRPSGTEPKVKLYGEAVDEDPAPFVDALASLLS